MKYKRYIVTFCPTFVPLLIVFKRNLKMQTLLTDDNNKVKILSLMAKEEFRKKSNVELCDNNKTAFTGSDL